MKIRKNYVMVVNPHQMTVIYKRRASGIDICEDSIVDVWDCTFEELKHNLKIMEINGFHIIKSN